MTTRKQKHPKILSMVVALISRGQVRERKIEESVLVNPKEIFAERMCLSKEHKNNRMV